jgi:hypothetical protein
MSAIPPLTLTVADLTATLRAIAAGPHSLNRLEARAVSHAEPEPSRAALEAELRDAPPIPERWARIDEQMEIEGHELRRKPEETP